MALRTENNDYYGDEQADIRVFLERITSHNYLATQFGDVVCNCGGQRFRLLVDDAVGVAIRTCVRCGSQYPMGDSADYMDEANLAECECPCGNGVFEVTVGIALYQDSQDVKWIYLGCRCIECSLIGNYGDWKNEYENFEEFLTLI